MKGRIDARNSLETYCYNMKTTIEDKLGDQLEDDDKDKVGSCKHGCAPLWCNMQCCAAAVWFQYMDRVGLTHAQLGSGVCGIFKQHASSALQLLDAKYQLPSWLVHALLDAPACSCAGLSTACACLVPANDAAQLLCAAG